MKCFFALATIFSVTIMAATAVEASPAVVAAAARNAKIEACQSLVNDQLSATGAYKEALGRRIASEGCPALGFSSVQDPRLEHGGVCDRLKAVLDDLLIAKDIRDEAAETFRTICME